MARLVAADEENVMVASETTGATQAVAFWTDLTPSERQAAAWHGESWLINVPTG